MPNRIEIVGIDKQNTPSIRQAGSNVSAQLHAQATLHERNRLDSVAEILALIAILVRQRVLQGTEVVAIAGALYQYDQGSVANHTQAAHCLPGHLTFNTQSIHDLDRWTQADLTRSKLKPIPIAAKLRNLGGRTDVADARINQTDSFVERMFDVRGLAPLLARATYGLIQGRALARGADWAAVREATWHAFTHYRATASLACEERLDRLTRSFPTLNAAQRTAAGEKMAILADYASVLQGAFQPSCLQGQNFAVLVRDVVTAS